MKADLVPYIIKLLCTAGGTVLDPTAGAMVSSIACLRTKRESVALKNGNCFRNTLGRVTVYATSHARMEELDAFVNPEASKDFFNVNTTCTHSSFESSKVQECSHNSNKSIAGNNNSNSLCEVFKVVVGTKQKQLRKK